MLRLIFLAFLVVETLTVYWSSWEDSDSTHSVDHPCMATCDDCNSNYFEGKCEYHNCISGYDYISATDYHYYCFQCPEGCNDCDTNYPDCDGSCLTGWTWNDNDKYCEKCIPHCDDCGNNYTCNSNDCEAKYYRSADASECLPCHASCPDCADSTGNCNSCPDGEWEDGTECTDCHTSCATCSSSTVCDTCPKGKSKGSGDTCVTACTASNCDYCDTSDESVCVTCKATWYKDPSGECTLRCNGTCATCTDDLSCATCPPGKWGTGNGEYCEYDCRGDCYTCSDATNCDSCAFDDTGYTGSSSDRCKWQPPSNCDNWKNGNYCYRCKKGYYNYMEDFNWYHRCAACDVTNCDYCLREGQCQICADGYKLYDDTCITTCPEGTWDNGLQCVDCDHEYLGLYECAKCNHRLECTECSASHYLDPYDDTNCLPCGDPKHIWDGLCLECTNNETCTLCSDFYYAKGGNCHHCPINCLSCKTGDTCDECIVGWSGDHCDVWDGYEYFGSKKIQTLDSTNYVDCDNAWDMEYRSYFGLSGYGIYNEHSAFYMFGEFRFYYPSSYSYQTLYGFNGCDQVKDSISTWSSERLKVFSRYGWMMLEDHPFFIYDVDFYPNKGKDSYYEDFLMDCSINYGSYMNSYYSYDESGSNNYYGIGWYKYTTVVGPWNNRKTITTYYRKDYKKTTAYHDFEVYTHTLVPRNLNEETKEWGSYSDDERYERVKMTLNDIGSGFTVYFQISALPVEIIHAKILRDLEGKDGWCGEMTDAPIDHRLIDDEDNWVVTSVNSDCSCKNEGYAMYCDGCAEEGSHLESPICKCAPGVTDADDGTSCSKCIDESLTYPNCGKCSNSKKDPFVLPACTFCKDSNKAGSSCSANSNWEYVGSRSLSGMKEKVPVPEFTPLGDEEKDDTYCCYCLYFDSNGGYYRDEPCDYDDDYSAYLDEFGYFEAGEMFDEYTNSWDELTVETKQMVDDNDYYFFTHFNEYLDSEKTLFDCYEISTRFGFTLLGKDIPIMVFDMYWVDRFNEDCGYEDLDVVDHYLQFYYYAYTYFEYGTRERVIVTTLPNSDKQVMTYYAKEENKDDCEEGREDFFVAHTVIVGNNKLSGRVREVGVDDDEIGDDVYVDLKDVSYSVILYHYYGEDITPQEYHDLVVGDLISKEDVPMCNGYYMDNRIVMKYYNDDCTCKDPKHKFPDCHAQCLDQFTNFPDCDECNGYAITSSEDGECDMCYEGILNTSYPMCNVCAMEGYNFYPSLYAVITGGGDGDYCTFCSSNRMGENCEIESEYIGSYTLSSERNVTNVEDWDKESFFRNENNFFVKEFESPERDNSDPENQCVRCLMWDEDKKAYRFRRGGWRSSSTSYYTDGMFDNFGYLEICKKSGVCESAIPYVYEFLFFDQFDNLTTVETEYFECIEATVTYGWTRLLSERGNFYYPQFVFNVYYNEKPGCNIDDYLFSMHGTYGDYYSNSYKIEDEDYKLVSYYAYLTSSYVYTTTNQGTSFVNYVVIPSNMDFSQQVWWNGEVDERLYQPLANAGHSLTMYLSWHHDGNFNPYTTHTFYEYDVIAKAGCNDHVEDSPYFTSVYDASKLPECVCNNVGTTVESACATCKPNVGPPGVCTGCVAANSNSSTYPDCLCSNGWEGEDCDVCNVRYVHDTNASKCEVCANHWEGMKCKVCPGNWDATQDCNKCKGKYEGTNCQTCPDAYTTASLCTACANKWTGDNCDVCPSENFDASCDACLDGYTGATCEDCAEGYVSNGKKCKKASSSVDVGAIVGGVLGGVFGIIFLIVLIVVIIVVIILLVLFGKKRQTNKVKPAGDKELESSKPEEPEEKKEEPKAEES